MTGAAAAPRPVLVPVVVAGLAAAGCVALWLVDPEAPGSLPVCPTKALLGIDCPGCGGLRMLHRLLHGDLPGALRFNALGVLAVLLAGWSAVAWLVAVRRDRPVRTWRHWRYTPAVVAASLIAWTVLRNLPFAPFTGLRV